MYLAQNTASILHQCKLAKKYKLLKYKKRKVTKLFIYPQAVPGEVVSVTVSQVL